MSKTRFAVLALLLAWAALLIETGGPESIAAPADETTAASAPSGGAPASKPTSRPARSHRRASRRSAMTAEQKEELKQFVLKHMPELWAHYEKLEKDNPKQGRLLLKHLNRLWRRVRQYPEGEVRQAAVARQRLNVEIYKVSRAYLQATDDRERVKQRQRLAEIIGQRFDADLMVKEYDVKRLQKELADLKAEIERRKSQRQAAIDSAVERITSHLATTQPAGKAGK